MKNTKLLSIFLILCLLLSGCGLPGSTGTHIEGFSRIRIIPSTEHLSDEEDLRVSKNNVQTFHQLEQSAGAFLCDSWQFDVLDGKERYTLHDPSADFPPEIADRHIVVTPNYFEFNPVGDTAGTPVARSFVQDTNTLNLLVPEMFRSRESDIIRIYQDYMYFNNVEVSEIYADRIGTERDTRLEKDFIINIIYVPDGQSYYIYKPDIAAKTGNAITDCLVVVLFPNQIHPVQIFGTMTRALFYHESWNGKAVTTDYIRSVFSQQDAEPSLGIILPLEDIYREYQTEQRTAFLIYSTIAAVVILIAVGIGIGISKKRKKKRS